ncbi:MAG: MoxR family ATPase [Armatimonadetes bacterium]|nr:MoxR family ATPase [Armatimonadota bacterium]
MPSHNIKELSQAIVNEVNRVIVGKTVVIEQTVLALLCEGHVLIEDVPGVGKTTLAKAISRAIGGEFRRVQFTPDLLPSDITGTSIFNQNTREFEFKEGPLFANVVLIDEVNRATPKTQSALLEAMEERQVTTDGVTRSLPQPFFVLATQNNIEMTGTYPLPEAQLDRFFSRVSIGYPDRDAEAEILVNQRVSHPVDTVTQVASLEELIAAQAEVKEVNVEAKIREYIVSIVRSTRENSQLILGSSPRGSLYVMQGAQAHAAMDGRDYVTEDDVKLVAPRVLGHRVMVRGEVRARGLSGDDIIRQIMESTAVPSGAMAGA